MPSTAAYPQLFVYIPTYNRPEALRRQLSVLAAQRDDWPGALRILVNDNASCALTDEDCVAMSSEFGVDVRRNPANIGGNANIALGFVFARVDEYLWILSDNDILGPGALHYIASQGVREGADAIVFSTKIDEPTEQVHQWSAAWDGVQETGLISNVIYRASVFLPHAAQAFFYHNTSFPHLCVLLSTLEARGSLSYRVLPSRELFAPESPHGEHPGDYSLSLTGMPQLLPLLPASQARKFARLWLRGHGREYFRHRAAYPAVFLCSRACLTAYGRFRARALLLALAVRHALFGRFDAPVERLARRVLPEEIKTWLRSHRR